MIFRSRCVWLCGRLISIDVETNPKSEDRKQKIENRIRMGTQQIKICVCLCRGVSPTGSTVCGEFLTHIICDFTILRFYDTYRSIHGERVLYIIGEVDNISCWLFTSWVRRTNWVSFQQISWITCLPPSPPFTFCVPPTPAWASKQQSDLFPRNAVSKKPFAASAYKSALKRLSCLSVPPLALSSQPSLTL